MKVKLLAYFCAFQTRWLAILDMRTAGTRVKGNGPAAVFISLFVNCKKGGFLHGKQQDRKYAGENWKLRCEEIRKQCDREIAEIDGKLGYIRKRIEELMFSPQVEKLRELMKEAAVYSAEDIEEICRLEATYIEECGRSDGGFEEISHYYEEQISTITSRYIEEEQEKIELGENDLER